MATTPANKPKFARIRTVTLPVLKLDPKAPRYLMFIGPMHVGEAIKAGEGKKQMEPATVAHAIDMETGEEGQLICSAMIKSQLERTYPGETYVGRGFELVSTKVPDKRYNIVTIAEVAVPEEIEAAAVAIRKASAGAKAAAKVAA